MRPRTCQGHNKKLMRGCLCHCLSSSVLFIQFFPRLIADHEICQSSSGFPTTKMNSKQGWRAGAAFLTVMFCFGMLWYLHVDSYIPRPYVNVGAICTPGAVASKAASLITNYSRNHPVFLQLSDYFWVKNESVYPLPYGTKGSEELLTKFLALSNQYHVPPEIERLRCRRCIVVGNGHRLKNSSLGEVINKYDVVIRLNNAPVHNYEKDVGSKTTMRFFYPESADFDPQLDNNPDTLLVLVPFKPLDIQWMKIIFNNEKRVRKGFWKMPPLIWEVTPQNTRILNPYYMEVTATKILDVIIANQKSSKKMKALFHPHADYSCKLQLEAAPPGSRTKSDIRGYPAAWIHDPPPPKPTTGMLAITFALHFCDLVDIAGFGYPALSNKKQPIHYYEKVTLKSMSESGHNITLEAIAIRNLLQHQIIHNLTYF
ncbi:CMP-N-acetylneuraminate-beta-galactosamide-alpha-2,3-sialyltransferase 4-like isoform X2 [Engystomops pustulosus]|uniref:CMP-N-acetylneuraminate-beta-galactosamide- alpha-2,3-sialyltransferase 4-like isoform X2 n=1 Tax=Engystomops pustulosus TaxID=76066 RepID=UPI003AFA934A